MNFASLGILCVLMPQHPSGNTQCVFISGKVLLEKSVMSLEAPRVRIWRLQASVRALSSFVLIVALCLEHPAASSLKQQLKRLSSHGVFWSPCLVISGMYRT